MQFHRGDPGFDASRHGGDRHRSDTALVDHLFLDREGMKPERDRCQLAARFVQHAVMRCCRTRAGEWRSAGTHASLATTSPSPQGREIRRGAWARTARRPAVPPRCAVHSSSKLMARFDADLRPTTAAQADDRTADGVHRLRDHLDRRGTRTNKAPLDPHPADFTGKPFAESTTECSSQRRGIESVTSTHARRPFPSIVLSLHLGGGGEVGAVF